MYVVLDLAEGERGASDDGATRPDGARRGAGRPRVAAPGTGYTQRPAHGASPRPSHHTPRNIDSAPVVRGQR